MEKLLVILGPTATGKTDLALFLAKKFNGEIISCDSRQVYAGLDIGTGKMPLDGKWSPTRHSRFGDDAKIEDGRWIVSGIPIHMYDVVDPKIQYSVADYVRDAGKVVREVRERGKLPIIVGGSGLYLKALLEGLANLEVPVDKKLRKELEKFSLKELQDKLQLISIKRWEKMNSSDRQNPRRLVRAIELILYQKSKIKMQNYKSKFKNFNVLKIGLTTSRDMLYQRVDQRVIDRIDQGMIDEAKRLHKNGLSLKRMKSLGLEYGVLAKFLSGEIREVGELIRVMQGEIHAYVRRQLTWFRRPGSGSIKWFNITDEDFADRVEALVVKWYHKLHGTKN